ERAISPPVLGDEDELVREGRAAEVAGQLDQGAGARAVFIRARRASKVVAMRDDDDHLLRERNLWLRPDRRGRDKVDEALPPEPRDVGRELLARNAELVVVKPLGHPVRRSVRAGRARTPVREAVHELLRELDGRRAVDGGRQTGFLQRDWPAEAECADQQGDGCGDPGRTVDPARHGPLQGPAPSPSPWRGNRHRAGAYPLSRWLTTQPSCSSTTRIPSRS